MNTIVVNNQSVTPSKIICIGRNYVEHITELDNEIPDEMVVFLKPNSAISTDLSSYHQEPVHYEAELCFVYQNGTFSAVGFGLDLTKRQLQSQLKAKGLPWERAKAFDGSAIFSEFVLIDQLDPTLSVQLKINNKVIQHGSIALMMVKPDDILSELAGFITLEDGDIVMTGTPKGVGLIEKGAIFQGEITIKNTPIVSGQWLAT
ncbi:fumarylacetoacetate hydrolase family protein [Colwelliaceae bacterium 6441]